MTPRKQGLTRHLETVRNTPEHLSPLQFPEATYGQRTMSDMLSTPLAQDAAAKVAEYIPQHDKAHVVTPPPTRKFGYPIADASFPERPYA